MHTDADVDIDAAVELDAEHGAQGTELRALEHKAQSTGHRAQTT